MVKGNESILQWRRRTTTGSSQAVQELSNINKPGGLGGGSGDAAQGRSCKDKRACCHHRCSESIAIHDV
jgi:hypothetical protein